MSVELSLENAIAETGWEWPSKVCNKRVEGKVAVGRGGRAPETAHIMIVFLAIVARTLPVSLSIPIVPAMHRWSVWGGVGTLAIANPERVSKIRRPSGLQVAMVLASI